MLSQLIRYAPIISLIGKTHPRRILEVGSGSQGLGKFLARRFVGAERDFSDYTGSERCPNPWTVNGGDAGDASSVDLRAVVALGAPGVVAAAPLPDPPVGAVQMAGPSFG